MADKKKSVWPIKDRAADMARGYVVPKKVCENTKAAIEEKK